MADALRSLHQRLLALQAAAILYPDETRATGALAPNVTAPRLPGGKFSATGRKVVVKKATQQAATKYGPLTSQQRRQLTTQLNGMIARLAAWPANDPQGYRALRAQALHVYRQLTYAKMHSARKPTARRPRARKR